MILQLARGYGTEITEVTLQPVLAAVVIVEHVLVEHGVLGASRPLELPPAVVQQTGEGAGLLSGVGLHDMLLQLRHGLRLKVTHRAHVFGLLEEVLALVHRDVGLQGAQAGGRVRTFHALDRRLLSHVRTSPAEQGQGGQLQGQGG